MPAPFRSPSAGIRELALLVATLALGFGLRVWDLNSQSLSADEVWELRNLVRPVAAPDGFPPLYNLLLRRWLEVFPGDLASRWLSVLFGVLGVYFGWLLGRRLAGKAVGLWTALLLAVLPLQIWYSRDGRMYTLYVLLATVSIWALFRALERDSLRDWSMYAAAAAAGMYVHYYFAILVFVGAIIILHERYERHQLKRPIAAYLALALLCLPLVGLLPPDMGLQADSSYTYRGGLAGLVYTYVSLITGYTIGPSLRELHTLSTAEAFVAFLPWLALMAPSMALLSFHGWRVLGTRKVQQLALLLAAPVAITFTLGILTGVGYHVRYVVWIVVPVAVLLAAGATRWRRWPVAAALAVLLGLFGVALANRQLSDRYRDEDMRALSAYLRSQPENRLPIFVLPSYMARPVEYYLGKERTIYALQGSPLDSLRVSRDLELIDSTTPAGQSYWLVYSREFHGDPDGSVRDSLEQRDRLRLVARFPGVVLYRGTRPGKVAQDSPGISPRPKRSTS